MGGRIIPWVFLLVCGLLVILAQVEGSDAASVQFPANGDSIKIVLEGQGDRLGEKIASERYGGRRLKNQEEGEEAAEKKKQEEEEVAAAEAAKKKQEEEAAAATEAAKKKKQEEEAAAEAAKKKKQEEEAAAAEAAKKKKQEEEAAAAAEAAKKKKQEEEAAAAEAAKKKKQEEEEQAQKEEEMNFEHILNTKIIPELKARCSTFPAWTSNQVERCISFAEDGIEYDPLIFDLDDEDFDFDYRRSITADAHAGAMPSLSQVSLLIAVTVLCFKYLPKLRKSRIFNLLILKARMAILTKDPSAHMR
eukprot:CAMPEP_0118807960 /NCGR_PEP_ID=MMETSP1161-20130426/35740_1 /TAXON_ID=249345 /ORGANISM="Picochlorum oklahomensis, Strain CCMP2329" /LENGTH=304 /DNA_ID=CAMNT_0006737345 /DNA_START=167 /DNA_END=1081 /DNA_ORIENTATION=+